MITSSSMDEGISETETAPEAPPPPVFDATPWPVAQRPVARPLRPVRIPRDLGPRMWTAALAAALLFTAGGLALLYHDDTNSQNAANKLNAQNQALKSQNKQLQTQLLTTQTNLSATLSELATVRAELEHPTLTIWNVPQQIKDSDTYLAGGAPDTFTYHLRATSSGPMSVSILTLEDFVLALNCVTSGRAVTNYCMHHTNPVISWLGVTTVNYDFHGAEGCADYVVVFTSAGNVTVTPDVGVTYNPAPTATGSCAK